jgi:hypothetical protein
MSLLSNLGGRSRRSETRKRIRRAAAAGGVAAAVVEALEQRQLLSFSIPADFELVESKSITAMSATATTFSVVEGWDYAVVVSGTARIGRRSDTGGPRLTDVTKCDAGNETGVFSITLSQPRVQLSGVADADGGGLGWGAYQSDHVYGQRVTATGGTIGASFVDYPYTDNSGALSVALYRPKVRLESLKVASGDNATNAVENSGTLYVLQDSNDQGKINVSGVVTPDSAVYKAATLWRIDELHAFSSQGNFAASSNNVTLTVVDNNRTWHVKAGVDFNGNGNLDAGEITKTVEVIVVKVDFGDDTVTTFLNTKNAFGITVEPSSAAGQVRLEIEDASKLSFDGGDSSFTLTPTTDEISVFGANVFDESGGGEYGQTDIGLYLSASTQPETKKKKAEAFSLAKLIDKGVQKGFDAGESAAKGELKSKLDEFISSQLSAIANDPDRPDNESAQAALDYYDADGKNLLHGATDSIIEGAFGDLRNGWWSATYEAFDRESATDKGNVKGHDIPSGDLSLNIDPIVKLASVDRILNNMNDLPSIFSRPGIFFEELGLKFGPGVSDPEGVTTSFSAKFSEDANEWKDSTLQLKFDVDLLKGSGGSGTVRLGATATYDRDDRQFGGSINAQIELGW